MYKQTIREAYDHLSPGYRRVADFLLNNYRDAAFMTAAQIGRSTSVDTTLVVRFAQRLGYPGFPELITEVQEEVKQDLRRIYEPIPAATTPAELCQRVLIQDRNNLEYMRLHLDADTVQKVVDILSQAPRVFLAGEGNSVYLAEAFATRLVALGRSAHVVPSEMAGQASTIMGARPDDAFVGFGMTPMAQSVAVLLKLARAEGAKTVGIVGTLGNPVASAAEYVLQAPVQTIGPMPSMTALTSMMHGLVEAVTIQMGAPTADWMLRTNRLLQEHAAALCNEIPHTIAALAASNLSNRAQAATSQ